MENNELINQWKKGLRIRHIAHTRAFRYYKLWDRIVGLVATLISAVVATTVFASMAESGTKTLIVVAGGISVLSTLVAATYTFLKFGELSERHTQAAASFGQLRRELEIYMMDDKIDSIDHAKLQEFNATWSELEKKVPSIPQRIYEKAKKTVSMSVTHKPK